METKSSPSDLLLDHIPASERATVLSSLIKDLQHDHLSDISLVASLIQKRSDDAAKEKLLTFLGQAVEAGKVESAVTVSLRHIELGNVLLRRATDVLSQAKSSVGDVQPEDNLPLFFLQFTKLTAPHLPLGDVHSKLLEVCLRYMESLKPETCIAAREVVFALLAAKDREISETIIISSQNLISKKILPLIDSRHKHHIETGYSLWLRSLLAADRSPFQGLNTDESWAGILKGLRHGDVERRKTCLNILKLTISTDAAAVSSGARNQLERYCTLFETIVLGRYINQIQECERDLTSLAQSNVLEQRWLLTLLACALDNRMLDSIRRFIGNWILRSCLKPSAGFLAFFRDEFLPWATQGQLFVSTLKNQDGQIRCLHGERLSNFIKSIRTDDSSPTSTVDTVVEMILRKRNAMFAYCTVYLLDGLKDALRDAHKERLSELTGFPEVARDYMSLKTTNAAVAGLDVHTQSRTKALEQQALKKIHEFKPDIDQLEDLWSDVEYLEFPKQLLIALPSVIFEPKVLQAALDDAALSSSIGEKFNTLQGITRTKTFLFAPLAVAIRNAVLTIPAATNILDLPEFVLQISEIPPEPTIDLMLEEAIIPLTPFTFEHYFGEPRSYGFAAYFDLVSRLSQHQNLTGTISYHILNRWKMQKVPPLTVSSWKTDLQLQVMLLCLEQYKPKTLDEISTLLDDLLHVLAIEPLPGYRFLLEWTVVRLIMRNDMGRIVIARLETKDHHSNPKHLASLMRIGTTLACTPDFEESFARQLSTTFIPLAASSKVVIRHEAQWQIPVLMDHARARGWNTISEDIALCALDDYIRSLERFNDPPLERQIGKFDPVADHTISNLVEGRWHGMDQAEPAVTSHDDFVKLYNKDTLPYAPSTCIPLGSRTDQPPPPKPETEPNKIKPTAVGPRTAEDVSSALQTKGTAYLARTLSSTLDASQRPARDIVVVASLVDNPHNLGGLSRVSEIFGASALTLQNQNVLGNKDFTSVSVSSHLHFPIVQLSAPSIPEFVAERKAEGYKVVGVEQTDRSVVLGSPEAMLPQKCVLVVGSEKEGIPARVLVECDVLVEIPQMGVTRSLNVQTAVSIVLFEYARQHPR